MLILSWIGNKFVNFLRDMAIKATITLLGTFRDHLISSVFDWGFVDFSEAVEILDRVTHASAHAPDIGNEGKESKKYIQQNLIGRIKNTKIRIYKNFGVERRIILRKEMEQMGGNPEDYRGTFIKKSELYKYLIDENSLKKKVVKLRKKMRKLDDDGRKISREYEELEEEANYLESKITILIYR